MGSSRVLVVLAWICWASLASWAVLKADGRDGGHLQAYLRDRGKHVTHPRLAVSKARKSLFAQEDSICHARLSSLLGDLEGKYLGMKCNVRVQK